MKEGLRYAVPLLALCGVTLLLLRARRYRPLDGRVRVALTAVAAAPLVASATVHLLRPSFMVALLPPWLPRAHLADHSDRSAGASRGAGAVLYGNPASGCGVALGDDDRDLSGQHLCSRRAGGWAGDAGRAGALGDAGRIHLLLVVAGYGWPEYGSSHIGTAAD